MIQGSRRGWWEFLEEYPDRRHAFEARHPELWVIRLLALFGPPAALALAGLTVVLSHPSSGSQGWWGGHPPTREGSPIVLVLIVIALAILFLGLLGYGIVRWREDRAVGQIALAIGWTGLLAAYVVFTQCGLELAGGTSSPTCLSIPAAVVVGSAWLVLWLSAGLVLDYRLWRRAEAPGEFGAY